MLLRDDDDDEHDDAICVLGKSVKKDGLISYHQDIAPQPGLQAGIASGPERLYGGVWRSLRKLSHVTLADNLIRLFFFRSCSA